MIPPVMCGDSCGGGNLPIGVEPQVRDERFSCGEGLQGGHVLGNEMLEEGPMDESADDIAFFILGGFWCNVVDRTALSKRD